MLTIPKNQALERWDTLPLVLREALYSESNSDFIWKTCESEHIPKENIPIVSGVTGYVLMGFLHPEDMAEELRQMLNIDGRICASIADSIGKRIFAPLRQEIDKAYNPISKLGSAPKIIQDMKPLGSAAIGSVPPPAAPLAGTFKVGGIPPQAPQMRTPPPAGPISTSPKSMSDVGWSKAAATMPTFQTPKGNFGTEALLSSIPRPSSGGPKAPTPEFDRLRTAQQAPSAPVTPAAGPAPVIIHEDASFKPAQQTPNFHIPTDQSKFNMQKGQLPIKTAIVELPNVISSPQRPIQAPPPKPFSNPSAPAMQQGDRHITEITTAPSMPGMMPTNPPSSQPKVVQKDYLGPPNPPKPPGQ